MPIVRGSRAVEACQWLPRAESMHGGSRRQHGCQWPWFCGRLCACTREVLGRRRVPFFFQGVRSVKWTHGKTMWWRLVWQQLVCGENCWKKRSDTNDNNENCYDDHFNLFFPCVCVLSVWCLCVWCVYCHFMWYVKLELGPENVQTTSKLWRSKVRVCVWLVWCLCFVSGCGVFKYKSKWKFWNKKFQIFFHFYNLHF